MASKTKVNLRDLMKKQRGDGKSASKRIDSPLAKYNSLGQLWCVVCNAQVKSEIVWPAHIQGRKHKDKVATLKSNKYAPVKPAAVPEPTVPRPPPPEPRSILKRRPNDPSVVLSVAKKRATEKVTTETVSTSSSSGLPSDFFDNSITAANSAGPATDAPAQDNEDSSKLPADFFDTTGSSSTTVSSSSNDKSSAEKTSSKSTDKDKKEGDKSSMAEALPEGFFDDPVTDAKIRKVEVKNTMEDEWEKYQKEMVTQKQVSENLQEEDEEEAQIVRNIDEIDEQINCFAKVEKLRDRQDAIKDINAKKLQQQNSNKDNEDSSSSADEAEFDELLDWRSKGAWK